METAPDEYAERLVRLSQASDVTIPRLKHWAYDTVCRWHQSDGRTTPDPACVYEACGGDLYNYQRVGLAWCIASKAVPGAGLIGDPAGAGKTGVILALLAWLKERGQLTKRAVVVTHQNAVTLQWAAEAERFIPGVEVLPVLGTTPAAARRQQYASGNWDVLIVTHIVAMKDKRWIGGHGPFAVVVSDDVFPLLDPGTDTHKVIAALSAGADRAFTINATSVQTALRQFHAATVPCGIEEVFGSVEDFERRFTNRVRVVRHIRRGVTRTQWEVRGYKRVAELQRRTRPLYLARPESALSDSSRPALLPPRRVILPMSPAQREQLDHLLATRTLRYRNRDTGEWEIRGVYDDPRQRMSGGVMFGYGSQICAGLPALGYPDGPGQSPKLDWLFDKLDPDSVRGWAPEDKALVFVRNPRMVAAGIARARAAGIGVGWIWGVKQSPEQRDAQRRRFQTDPTVRLMFGTTASEKSLNLQSGNRLVALDTHLNPKRMEQLLGRVRRAGSRHTHVSMDTLLMADTQEDFYFRKLSNRAAISDMVFQTKNEMYEALSEAELERMMQQ